MSTETTIANINNLPIDCLRQILLQVPVQSVPIPSDGKALQLVCKTWERALNDPNNGAYPILAGNYSQTSVIQKFMPTQAGLSGFQSINQTINKIKAYYEYYFGKSSFPFQPGPIDPQSLQQVILQTNQRKSDQNLITFYTALREEILELPEPQLNESKDVQANSIRKWMNDYHETLGLLTVLNLGNHDLTELHLTELPPEIGNLVNLQRLVLDGNQLTALPP